MAIARTMLGRFQRSLEDLRIRHIRTQVNTPWTNGKIEAFWATLQAEVLDRQQFRDLSAAEDVVTAYAGYDDYHASTALSSGRHRPSAPMAPPSPTRASRTCLPSAAWPIYSTRSWLRAPSLICTGKPQLADQSGGATRVRGVRAAQGAASL